MQVKQLPETAFSDRIQIAAVHFHSVGEVQLAFDATRDKSAVVDALAGFFLFLHLTLINLTNPHSLRIKHTGRGSCDVEPAILIEIVKVGRLRCPMEYLQPSMRSSVLAGVTHIWWLY